MAQITLHTGEVVLIDDADYPLVSQYNWHRSRQGRNIYAIAHVWKGGKRTTISMHRLIMGESALVVDHINQDGFDNRRSNLRWATTQQNRRNGRPHKARRFKGVYLLHSGRYRKSWQAQLRVEGRIQSLGYYATEEEGARAYDAAVKRLYGEFANLNFPEGETINGCTTHQNL